MLGESRDVKLNLAIELGNKGALKRMLEWLSESALVHHDLESVFLEQKEEFFGGFACHDLLLGHDLLALVCPLLQVPPLRLVGPPLAGRLHSLSLNELRLLHLQEKFLVLREFLLLEVLDRLDLSQLEGLTHQHLQDGLSFQLEIEQVPISVVHLDHLDVTLWVRHEYRGRLNKLIYLKVNLLDGRCSSRVRAAARLPCSHSRLARPNYFNFAYP